MADVALRHATYEDLLQVPEHLVAEIINGRLVTHPRPASKHQRQHPSPAGAGRRVTSMLAV